jgi:hypothetical protein
VSLSPEDCATLAAYFEGVEAARRELEGKWGIGRAELLASDDLRARWRRQCASWRAAYAAAWESQFLTRDQLQLVQDKAGAMRRGYAALDAHAEEAGHRPIAPWVWEVMLPQGEVAAIVQTNAEAGKVIADGRYLVVYTLAEVGAVIAALPDALSLAKQTFPGARFQTPRSQAFEAIEDRLGNGPWRPEGDEIPFGEPIGRELQAMPAAAAAAAGGGAVPVEAETWD